MSELQIYDSNEMESLKLRDLKSHKGGYVYILEYADDLVKIGSSYNPYQRVKSMKMNVEKYGLRKIKRLAITQAHTNFRENEKLLHKIFADIRIDRSELFNFTFDQAVEEISKIELPDSVDYNKRQTEAGKKIEKFINALQNMSFEENRITLGQLAEYLEAMLLGMQLQHRSAVYRAKAFKIISQQFGIKLPSDFDKPDSNYIEICPTLSESYIIDRLICIAYGNEEDSDVKQSMLDFLFSLKKKEDPHAATR